MSQSQRRHHKEKKSLAIEERDDRTSHWQGPYNREQDKWTIWPLVEQNFAISTSKEM